MLYFQRRETVICSFIFGRICAGSHRVPTDVQAICCARRPQRTGGWCHMKLLPSRRVLCTPYNHAPCHFMQTHIPKVYACLAVTCHPRLWQNDRGLLRATAVTRGWNGYRNKSQHRKLTLEKKILQPLQQEFEPATFSSRVRRS